MRIYKGKAFDALVEKYRNDILQEERNGERIKHHWERLNVSEREFFLNMDHYEKEIQAYERALTDVGYIRMRYPWKVIGVDMVLKINVKWNRERAFNPLAVPEHNLYIPESEIAIGGYGSPIDWNFAY